MNIQRKEIALTPRLCKAARALLGWTSGDLAEHSGVSGTTIRIFESEARKISRLTMFILVQTFMEQGIEFLPTGVQLHVVRELEAA
jgi:DNA-binding XRE family transcriptional regulator